MTTKKIRVEVEAPGADTAATKIETVAERIKRLDKEQKAAKKSAEDLAKAEQKATLDAISFTTKIAAAAGAVQGLATALGAEGGAVGLIGKLAQSAAAGAQLGAAFGPQGALVGGILGAAIPALQSLVSAQDDAAEASERVREATRLEASQIETLTQRLNAQRRAREELNRTIGGNFRSADEAEGAIATARQTITDTEGNVAALRERLEITEGIAGAEARTAEIRRQIRAMEAESVRAQIQIGSAEEFLQTETQREIASAAPRARTGGGDTGPDDRSARAAAQLQFDEAERLAERRAEIEQRRLDEEARVRAERIAAEEELNSEILRLERERFEESQRLQEQASEELGRRIEDARVAALEAGRAQAETQMAVVQNVADGIGRAISKIAETNATADESAKIVLATTLEVIGQTAQMLAGMEFAKAIAAYPDVAGMALHAAAGVAFTAVAIGTGEGAGALNRDVAASQAARAEKPEKPESGGSGAKSGGDTIVNINSPIVTAQTHAELGRSVRNMLVASERRAA